MWQVGDTLVTNIRIFNAHVILDIVTLPPTADDLLELGIKSPIITPVVETFFYPLDPYKIFATFATTIAFKGWAGFKAPMQPMDYCMTMEISKKRVTVTSNKQ